MNRHLGTGMFPVLPLNYPRDAHSHSLLLRLLGRKCFPGRVRIKAAPLRAAPVNPPGLLPRRPGQPVHRIRVRVADAAGAKAFHQPSLPQDKRKVAHGVVGRVVPDAAFPLTDPRVVDQPTLGSPTVRTL